MSNYALFFHFFDMPSWYPMVLTISTFTVLQSLGWNSLHLLALSKKPQKLRSLFGRQMLGSAQQRTYLREQCHRRIKKNKTQK